MFRRPSETHSGFDATKLQLELMDECAGARIVIVCDETTRLPSFLCRVVTCAT
jgi:hypothetical protein